MRMWQLEWRLMLMPKDYSQKPQNLGLDHHQGLQGPGFFGPLSRNTVYIVQPVYVCKLSFALRLLIIVITLFAEVEAGCEIRMSHIHIYTVL